MKKLILFFFLISFLQSFSQQQQQYPDTVYSNYRYEADFGFGYGLIYGGYLGGQLQYSPHKHLAIFGSGGGYFAVGLLEDATSGASELLVYSFDGTTLTLTSSFAVPANINHVDYSPTGTQILVAIDGSQNAYKALEYAIRLAVDYGAQLNLLTVVPDFEPKSDEESAYQRMLVVRAESYLDSAVEEVEETNPDITVETEIVYGDPAEKIITIADKSGVDMIVLGSRGLSGVQRWVLGSVSDRVSDYAPCTVLIVK